jgi:hypothetical protein
MEPAGVPISNVSKWAGHHDSAFTQKTYVHQQQTGPRLTSEIKTLACGFGAALGALGGAQPQDMRMACLET